MEGNNKKFHILRKKQKDMIFVTVLCFLPFIQFFIFYLCVNFNSVIMAFQSYEINLESNSFVISWNNFDNFKKFYYEFIENSLLVTCLRNSFLNYCCGIIFGIVLCLLFSYYIYSKRFGGSFFKIILFMPSIISSIVMITMFRFFVNVAIPHLISLIINKKVESFLLNPATALGTVIFYNIWAGFGTGILLYSGAMANISNSIIEAADIDGAGEFRKFIKIILPLIFPTLKTFLITGISAIFISDIGMFSFFSESAEKYLYTFGYYILRNTRMASFTEYPYLASVGIILTLLAVPITLVLKFFLEKFGPTVE